MQRTLINTATLTNTFYSHSNRDRVNTDGIHGDGASMVRSGKRFARSISTYLGSTSGQPHWAIASCAVVDATTTTVDVTHGLGTDFTPTSGISGFEVSGDNGANWVTATGVRTSATRITLTHASVATNSNRKLRYQYGLNPDVSALVLDNSTLTLPLDNSANALSPTPLATLPVPTYSASSGASNGSGQTQSLLNASIGAAAARRMVIFAWTMAGGGSALSSATITPNVGTAKTVTIAKQQPGTPSSPPGGIAYAVLDADADTATTVTIALTFAANPFNTARINVWYLPSGDLSSTAPVDAQIIRTAATTSVNLNLATSAGGFAIAAAVSITGVSNSGAISSSNETWASRTNNLANGAQHVAADASGLTAQVADTITATFATAQNTSLVAASWR
jgi:hypothetical protein